MARTFSPKPGEVGSPITWTHVLADGSQITRTGVVVGQAPIDGYGHTAARWVVADAVLDSDVYPGGVVVAKCSTRSHNAGDPVSARGSWVRKGEAFSSDVPGTPTAVLATTNARLSAREVAA